MKNLKQCPLCKVEAIQYSQNAEIPFEIKDGKLVPQTDIHSIGFLDDSTLYCHDCGEDSNENEELHELKKEYEEINN